MSLRELARRRLRRSGGLVARIGGFTMIELLVTMLILAIVLLGLAALQVGTIRQVTASRRANEATRICARVIEQYRYMSMVNLQAALVSDGAWHPRYIDVNGSTTPQTLVGPDGQSDGPYSVFTMMEPGVGSSLIVTVQVRWKDIRPGAEKSDMNKKYQEFSVTMSIRRYI